MPWAVEYTLSCESSKIILIVWSNPFSVPFKYNLIRILLVSQVKWLRLIKTYHNVSTIRSYNRNGSYKNRNFKNNRIKLTTI